MYIVRIKDDVLRKSFGDKNSFIIVFSWFKLFKEIIVRILIINVDLMIFFGNKREENPPEHSINPSKMCKYNKILIIHIIVIKIFKILKHQKYLSSNVFKSAWFNNSTFLLLHDQRIKRFFKTRQKTFLRSHTVTLYV